MDNGVTTKLTINTEKILESTGMKDTQYHILLGKLAVLNKTRLKGL